jgi:hypothetical protein
MGTRTSPVAGSPARNWVSGLPLPPRGRHRRRPLPVIAACGTDGGEQRFDGKFPTAVPPQPASNDKAGGRIRAVRADKGQLVLSPVI